MKPLNSIIYPKWTQSITMALFLLAVSSTSLAQSEYGIIGQVVADSTITRVWHEDPLEWVDYASKDTNGAFYLRKEGTNAVASVELKDKIITDFEILNDTVFFCGYDSTRAFVGSFDIAKMFAGTDHFTILYSGYFKRAYKIAVFRGTSCTQLAVIGYSASRGYGISDFHWIPSVSIQEFNYSESSLTEVFEDVDVTDNYVVAVENKGYPHGSHYMRVFDKYYSPSFLSSPIGWDIYGIHTSNYSRNLVTHITGDYFAVVALALQQNTQYGNLIFLYNGTTFLGSIYTPLWNYYDTLWCMRDFRYNPKDDKLYLLEDMTRTGQGNAEPLIFQYDYHNPTNPVKAYYTPNVSFLYSIDCTPSGIVLGSGCDGHNNLYSFQWNIQSMDNCLSGIKYNNISPSWIPIVFDNIFNPGPFNDITIPFVPAIMYHNYNPTCQ